MNLRILDSPSAPGTVILTVIRFGSETGSILEDRVVRHFYVTRVYCVAEEEDVVAGDNRNKVGAKRVDEVVFVVRRVWPGRSDLISR